MMLEGILIRQRTGRFVRSVSDADAEVFRQIAARPEAYRAEYSQLPPPSPRSFRDQQGYVFRKRRRIRIQCRLYHLPMSIGALVIALERRYNPRFYLARWVQTASLSDLPETHRMWFRYDILLYIVHGITAIVGYFTPADSMAILTVVTAANSIGYYQRRSLLWPVVMSAVPLDSGLWACNRDRAIGMRY